MGGCVGVPVSRRIHHDARIFIITGRCAGSGKGARYSPGYLAPSSRSLPHPFPIARFLSLSSTPAPPPSSVLSAGRSHIFMAQRSGRLDLGGSCSISAPGLWRQLWAMEGSGDDDVKGGRHVVADGWDHSHDPTKEDGSLGGLNQCLINTHALE